MTPLSQPTVPVPASDPREAGSSPGVADSNKSLTPAPLRDDPARVPSSPRTVMECGCVIWHADDQLHTDRSACTMQREVAVASLAFGLAATLKGTYA